MMMLNVMVSQMMIVVMFMMTTTCTATTMIMMINLWILFNTIAESNAEDNKSWCMFSQLVPLG